MKLNLGSALVILFLSVLVIVFMSLSTRYDTLSPEVEEYIQPARNTVLNEAEDTQYRSTKSADNKSQKTQRCIDNINSMQRNEAFIACLRQVIPTAQDAEVIQLVTRISSKWLMIDWQAALNYMMSLQAHHRDYLLDWAISRISFERFNEVVVWILEQDLLEAQQVDYLTALFLPLVADEPEKAIDALDLLDNEQFRRVILTSIMDLWGNNDAQSALVWLIANRDGDDFRDDQFTHNDLFKQLKSNVEIHLIEQDVLYAGEYIRTMPLSDNKVALASYYANFIAQSDFDKAVQWAESIDEYAVYQTAIAAAIEIGAQAEATQWKAFLLAGAQKDPAFRDILLANISVQVSAFNLDKMLEVMPTLPESAQLQVVDAIVINWLEKDEAQLFSWVNTLSEGPLEIAVKTLISDSVIQNNPEKAFNIAASINNNQARFNVFKSLITYLSVHQPAQANNHLDTIANVTEEQRLALANILH